MSGPDPLPRNASKPNNGGSPAPVYVNDSNIATTTNAESSTAAAAHDHRLSSEEFQAWLLQRFLQDHAAMHAEYPQVFESAAAAITNWRRRFHGDAALWKRLFDEKKIMKEFIEACPIIDAVQRLVRSAAAAADDERQSPFTIVDLACGKGYLSMLLSEMLPPSQVTRFVLMDKAWACHGTTELSAHHMNWDHIHDAKYKDSWPIPLVPCKQDLKSARQRRKLQEYYFDNKNNNKVILLAVHLCGTLSLKAVDFFNQNANISFFCLKPCCLPGMIHAKRHEIFTLTSQKDYVYTNSNDDENDNTTCRRPTPPSSEHVYQHSFPAKSVCMHGKWKKNKWQGPPRQSLIPYFETWSKNLFMGIAACPFVTSGPGKSDSLQEGGRGGTLDHSDSDGTDKNKHDDDNNNKSSKNEASGDHQEQSSCGTTALKLQKTIMVQIDGGYQNEFLFAQRLPATEEVWEALVDREVSAI